MSYKTELAKFMSLAIMGTKSIDFEHKFSKEVSSR